MCVCMRMCVEKCVCLCVWRHNDDVRFCFTSHASRSSLAFWITAPTCPIGCRGVQMMQSAVCGAAGSLTTRISGCKKQHSVLRACPRALCSSQRRQVYLNHSYLYIYPSIHPPTDRSQILILGPRRRDASRRSVCFGVAEQLHVYFGNCNSTLFAHPPKPHLPRARTSATRAQNSFRISAPPHVAHLMHLTTHLNTRQTTMHFHTSTHHTHLRLPRLHTHRTSSPFTPLHSLLAPTHCTPPFCVSAHSQQLHTPKACAPPHPRASMRAARKYRIFPRNSFLRCTFHGIVSCGARTRKCAN